jgi:hypothetical protein
MLVSVLSMLRLGFILVWIVRPGARMLGRHEGTCSLDDEAMSGFVVHNFLSLTFPYSAYRIPVVVQFGFPQGWKSVSAITKCIIYRLTFFCLEAR